MAIKFDYDESTLKSGLGSMGEKVTAAVMMYATTKATVLESYMKVHRPWTDRTGMAKATLNAKVSKPDNHTVRITLAHGVDYGISLELEHEKAYAIVGPTVEIQGPRLVTELNNLLSSVKL